jgi:hypothetical protein
MISNTLKSGMALREIIWRKGGYTLVTLPRIVTPYRDSVDETRAHTVTIRCYDTR